MKKILLLASIFLMFGCNNNPDIPRAIIPPAPKQAQSALPSIKKVDNGVNESIVNNGRLGQNIEESKQTINDQNLSIIEALAQAEKMRDKALSKVIITELEVTNLISELKKVQTRNLFLERQNQELIKLKDGQDKILEIIKNTLGETEHLISDKEIEANELRTQNEFLVKNLSLKNDESEKLKFLLQKEKEKSATASVYKNWVVGLVVSFIAWLAIKNILMIYFPLAKFRI